VGAANAITGIPEIQQEGIACRDRASILE